MNPEYPERHRHKALDGQFDVEVNHFAEYDGRAPFSSVNVHARPHKGSEALRGAVFVAEGSQDVALGTGHATLWVCRAEAERIRDLLIDKL